MKSPIQDDEVMGNSGAPSARGIALLALLLLALGNPACSGGGGVPEETSRRSPSGTSDRATTSPAPPDPIDLPSLEGKRAGALRMKARIEAIVAGLDVRQNSFLNARRAAFLERAIRQARNPEQRLVLTTHRADDLLKAGDPQAAIDIVLPLLTPDPSVPGGGPPIDEVREFLSLCYLRLGELQNCIARHTPRSCLLPIRGDGIHSDQRGSRAAIEHLLALLEMNPAEPGGRWLLNIAFMTLGEYPDGVPDRFLIPPEVFRSEAEVSSFTNVAQQAGVAIRGEAGGGLMEDFDEDGLLDIVVSSMGIGDPVRYLHNDGDGTFSDRSEASGLSEEPGGLNLMHADYDNDGDVDILVLRGGWMRKGGLFPNSLLRNEGDGTFEDVTEQAGLLSFHPTQTAAWADYDNDGLLDLFIGNESADDDSHPSELYHNEGNGTFTNRAFELGDPDLGYVKGVAWGDFNNDGLMDLYVSVLNQDNRLFRNDGPRKDTGPSGERWKFTDIARAAGVTEPQNSFPTWFWDYDNDGRLDILVAGYKTLKWDRPCRLIDCVGKVARFYLGLPHDMETPRLYHNEGDGTFREVSRETGMNRVVLPMGANFGDIDNDGWLDAYFGTGEPSLGTIIPNRMFRNDGGRAFQDVTTSVDVGHLQKGHGVAFGDIDNDGDQDLFIELGGFYAVDAALSALFMNPGSPGSWVTLRFEGRRSNRSAIGARVVVRLRVPGGVRAIHRTVGTGGSFGGNSLQLEIGLGDAVSIETIEVTWPTTGETQQFREVRPRRFYRIVEGEPALEELKVPTFRFEVEPDVAQR